MKISELIEELQTAEKIMELKKLYNKAIEEKDAAYMRLKYSADECPFNNDVACQRVQEANTRLETLMQVFLILGIDFKRETFDLSAGDS